MKLGDLRPGQYELREDVINPDGDRRRKSYLISATTWPKGTRVMAYEAEWPRFVVEEAKKSGTVLPPRMDLKILPYGHYMSGAHIYHGNDAYEYLVEAMEPVEEDLQGLLDRSELSDCYYEDLLEEMLKRRMVTLAAVESAIKSLKASWGEE